MVAKSGHRAIATLNDSTPQGKCQPTLWLQPCFASGANHFSRMHSGANRAGAVCSFSRQAVMESSTFPHFRWRFFSAFEISSQARCPFSLVF